MRNLWYFGLEPLKERYTLQLSTQWTPSTFQGKRINFIPLEATSHTGEIGVGVVLDAYGRGVYAMQQCQNFMRKIALGHVKENDIVLLQDFWTPGFESIMYMLDLYGIRIKLYSMLHAQSVDEYDFTYEMRHWMRGFELGLDAYHSGIFVGSSIHKEQLRAAGFKSPIHVMGLPINKKIAINQADLKTSIEKQKQVIYTSRLDKEKNPYFMVEVALMFLEDNADYDWVVTTSGKDFRSNVDGFVDYLKSTAQNNSRFKLLSNLTKKEYYSELKKSKIQFNSSLQDYVSWTLIESTMFGCDVCYPNFRSFPEIIDNRRMYKPFNHEDALRVLNESVKKHSYHFEISETCDLGRRMEAFIMLNDIGQEFNVWHEKDLIKTLVDKC